MAIEQSDAPHTGAIGDIGASPLTVGCNSEYVDPEIGATDSDFAHIGLGHALTYVAPLFSALLALAVSFGLYGRMTGIVVLGLMIPLYIGMVLADRMFLFETVAGQKLGTSRDSVSRGSKAIWLRFILRAIPPFAIVKIVLFAAALQMLTADVDRYLRTSDTAAVSTMHRDVAKRLEIDREVAHRELGDLRQEKTVLQQRLLAGNADLDRRQADYTAKRAAKAELQGRLACELGGSGCLGGSGLKGDGKRAQTIRVDIAAMDPRVEQARSTVVAAADLVLSTRQALDTVEGRLQVVSQRVQREAETHPIRIREMLASDPAFEAANRPYGLAAQIRGVFAVLNERHVLWLSIFVALAVGVFEALPILTAFGVGNATTYAPSRSAAQAEAVAAAVERVSAADVRAFEATVRAEAARVRASGYRDAAHRLTGRTFKPNALRRGLRRSRVEI